VISADEMSKLMKEMGLDISDSQLLQILDTFDADQDGEINVDEFRQLMLNI
jgi:Ca2+-binding EF-hand superfamily protein